MSDAAPDDFSGIMNQARGGWAAAMGIVMVEATRDRVVAEIEIGPAHLQPYGIVHGGVHAGILETLASAGAAITAGARGQTVVGLENHTSFVRAVRAGRLRATVTPLTRGRRSQLWEGAIVDAHGRMVATGRVRLLCLDPDAALAGQSVSIAEE